MGVKWLPFSDVKKEIPVNGFSLMSRDPEIGYCSWGRKPRKQRSWLVWRSHRQQNMNRINIDHLTEAELVDLIIELWTLRLMSQVHAHQSHAGVPIGDRVTLNRGWNSVFGILTR